MDTLRNLARAALSFVLAIVSITVAAAVFLFGSIIVTGIMIVVGIGGVIALATYGFYAWFSEKDESEL